MAEEMISVRMPKRIAEFIREEMGASMSRGAELEDFEEARAVIVDALVKHKIKKQKKQK